MENDYSSHSLRSRKRIYQNIHRFALYKRSASTKEKSFLEELGPALKLNKKQQRLLSGKGQRGELVTTASKKERTLILFLLAEFLTVSKAKPPLSEQQRLLNIALRVGVEQEAIRSLIKNGLLDKKILAQLEITSRKKAYLEERFPGMSKKMERWSASGLEFIVFKKEHKTTRHTCFGYGGDCGVDVSTTFNSTLILLPSQEVDNEEAYVSFYISGYSSYSDRYDQNSVSIECRFPDGKKMELRREYYYEKYGGRTDNAWGELEVLGTYLHDVMGYDSLTAEDLREVLKRMRSAFSY